MARPSGRTIVGRASRRLTEWIAPANQGYVGVATGGATLNSSFSFDDPETIVRTRGQISIIPTSVAADADFVGAVGIGIVSNEAFAAGVGSIPEPFTDADWGGWFVWRSFSYHLEFSTAVGIQFPNWNFEVDSKAMRKAGSNEVAVIIAESQVGAFQISTPLRLLSKLH